MRIVPAILIVLILAAGCYKPKSESFPLGSAENPLVMAFVPSTEAEKVIESGDELASLLGAETGLSFKTQMSTSYVGIVEAMAVGKVQVAWLPPMAYVYAHDRNGDEVILKAVRNGKPTYRGQIVVLADSEIQTVADLRGKRVAFTEQTSTSGHYYPAALLREAGLDPQADIEPLFAGSHDAAVLALVKGSVDAASCYDDARDKLVGMGFPDILTETRVLAYTPEIPADNVAVIKELDSGLAAQVKSGLLALAASAEGARVLMELYEIEGLVPAADADYDPVRRMVALLDKDLEAELKDGG
jgi:phosphonate transport system substrate-binding protein